MNASQKLRFDIMELVFKTDNVELLQLVKSELKKSAEKPDFLEAVKPLQKDLSLNQIIEKQNYKPVSYATFRAKADELEWNVTLEELLKALE